jgi:hypothetical protein
MIFYVVHSLCLALVLLVQLVVINCFVSMSIHD